MKTRIAAFLGLAVLLLAGSGFAQTPPADTSSETVAGTIVSASPTQVVIKTDSGVQRSFAVDNTTLLPAPGLSSGNRVTVQFRTLDATRSQAVDVSLVDSDANTATAANEPASAGSYDSGKLRTSTAPVAAAPEVTPAAPASSPSPEPSAARLPSTASPLPLLALLGIVALTGAAVAGRGARLS